MSFFRFYPPVDPVHLQSNFLNTLKRHNFEKSPEDLKTLFARLHEINTSSDNPPDCPFPLVKTVSAAYSHAKRLKASLGGNAGPKLGKCQQVLADFYGFGKWDFFTEALFIFESEKQTTPSNTAEAVVSTEIQQPTVAVPLAQRPQPPLNKLLVEADDAAYEAAMAAMDAQQAEEEAAYEAAMAAADAQQAEEEAAYEAAMAAADAQQAEEEAAEEAAMAAFDAQLAAQEAEEEAAYEAAMAAADAQLAEEEAYEDAIEDDGFLEDDPFVSHPRDWVDGLDPEVQDFASQFDSEEEFEEYMDRF